MSVRKCSATTVDGGPCRAPALRSSSECFQHAPEVSAQRDEARRRGGRLSSRRARIEKALGANPSVANVVDVMADTITQLQAGAISPSVANSIASVGRVLLAGISEAQTAERLAELERVLDRFLHDDGGRNGLRVVS